VFRLSWNNLQVVSAIKFCWTIQLYILLIIQNTTGMPNLKITSTSQVHIHKYEDLKRKTYNCNVNIYFNQKCLRIKRSRNYKALPIVHKTPLLIYSLEMASWKPKHCTCYVALINFVLRNKFVLDCTFIYFINYLCLFVTDIKGSEFSDFSLPNSNSKFHCRSDVMQITYQSSLHKLLSNIVNVTLKEHFLMFCWPCISV
jgi:hypothetical protein